MYIIHWFVSSESFFAFFFCCNDALGQLVSLASVGRGVLARQAAPSDRGWPLSGSQVQGEQRGQSARCCVPGSEA